MASEHKTQASVLSDAGCNLRESKVLLSPLLLPLPIYALSGQDVPHKKGPVPPEKKSEISQGMSPTQDLPKHRH